MSVIKCLWDLAATDVMPYSDLYGAWELMRKNLQPNLTYTWMQILKGKKREIWQMSLKGKNPA